MTKFQSLIGRLQTRNSPGSHTGSGKEFQSLIGRLQTAQKIPSKNQEAGFQSLIGRLQTGDKIVVSGTAHKFQSLIGRLQTNVEGRCHKDSVKSFNPS